MTTPDLTPTLREALTKTLDSALRNGFLSLDEADALVALRDACPERPALEDGIYEEPDEDGDYSLRYVRNGRHGMHRNPDGALYDSLPLPADVSGWRRIDSPRTVTPEQIEEAARAVSGHSESQWATLGEGIKDCYRARARRILAAAGIEVQP